MVTFLQAQCIKVVGQFEISGQQRLPPTRDFPLWSVPEIGTIVNSPKIANLFACTVLPLEDMIYEEKNQIMQARLALYGCEATMKLSKCFANKSTALLLHGLYATHGSTDFSVVILALSATLVSNIISRAR